MNSSQKRTYGRMLWMVTVLICVAAGTAFAVRPSGPGRTTAANSLSVALASDHANVPVSPQTQAPVPTIVTAVTRDTDMTTVCKDGVVVGGVGDGGLEILATGSDAGVKFTVIAGQYLPVATKAVLTDDGGTSIGANLNCLSH